MPLPLVTVPANDGGHAGGTGGEADLVRPLAAAGGEHHVVRAGVVVEPLHGVGLAGPARLHLQEVQAVDAEPFVVAGVAPRIPLVGADNHGPAAGEDHG